MLSGCTREFSGRQCGSSSGAWVHARTTADTLVHHKLTCRCFRCNPITHFLALMLTLFRTPVAQVCDDGTPGVQSTSFDVCCSVECSTCGGPQCGQQNTTNGAFDCCVTEIMESNLFCTDTGVSPCILQASEYLSVT